MVLLMLGRNVVEIDIEGSPRESERERERSSSNFSRGEQQHEELVLNGDSVVAKFISKIL